MAPPQCAVSPPPASPTSAAKAGGGGQKQDTSGGDAGGEAVQAGAARASAGAAAGRAAAPAPDAAMQRAPHRLRRRRAPGPRAPPLRAPQPRRTPAAPLRPLHLLLRAHRLRPLPPPPPREVRPRAPPPPRPLAPGHRRAPQLAAQPLRLLRAVPPLVEEGLSLYRSMETFGLLATPQHHCCIVDLLAKGGRVDEAYDFVESLGEDGNFIAIYGSLLASCKAQGKMELAAWATEKVLNMEKQYGHAHAGYNVLLSQLFAAEGNWSSADSLRKEMRLRRLTKKVGSSWIEVQSAALQDRSMDRNQNYPENEHIFLLDGDI